MLKRNKRNNLKLKKKWKSRNHKSNSPLSKNHSLNLNLKYKTNKKRRSQLNRNNKSRRCTNKKRKRMNLCSNLLGKKLNSQKSPRRANNKMLSHWIKLWSNRNKIPKRRLRMKRKSNCQRMGWISITLGLLMMKYSRTYLNKRNSQLRSLLLFTLISKI